MNIKYPKNLHEWFSDGRDTQFNKWAFGCDQPGSNQKMIELWDALHPQYPMTKRDILYVCICKMNYLYNLQRGINHEKE